MVPPKVTTQLPNPEVKVEEKILKAKVVDEHIEKIQELQTQVIEVKVLREKVFEVDEAFDIENLRANSFQVRGNVGDTWMELKTKQHRADKHLREKLFQVGDEVMVFIYKEHFSVGTYSKLQPKKHGPYMIPRKINNNAYVLDMPNTMSISKTFNVSYIYEFHSGNMNGGKHLRINSSEEMRYDVDMINELARGTYGAYSA
ncbi:hypothetical protein Tco_0685236 [Tanacetum coccineum]